MAGMRARSEGPGILPDDVRGPVEAERIGEERGKGAGDLRRREDERQLARLPLREMVRIDADPVDAQQLPVSYDFRSDAVDLEGSRHPDSIGGRESALIEVRGCRADDDCARRDRHDVPAVVYGRDGGIAAHPHEYDVRYRL